MMSLVNFIGTLKTVRVQYEENLCKLKFIESVVIVGSTCAGKTTIADAIRKSSASQMGRIEVPLRYITRPKRQNDNTNENIHVSPEELSQKILDGDIGLHWVRNMEGNREERYGFKKVEDNKMPVYSANNAIYNNAKSISPEGILSGALFLGVYAPDEIRRERLLIRSPDLLRSNPEEVAYRLADSSDNIFNHIHVAIHNYGVSENSSVQEAVQLVEHIVKTRGSND